MTSLLPPNATRTERALDAAGILVGAIDGHMDTLRNPDTIPADLLPWLAWDRSVDAWDTNWSEAQKRAVVKVSIRVHQHKGTAGAMIDALAALDYSAHLVEWWQTTPRGAPYTFRVDVSFAAALITAAIYDEVERVALSAKNARSHLRAVRAIATLNGVVYVGGGSMSAVTTTVYQRAA